MIDGLCRISFMDDKTSFRVERLLISEDSTILDIIRRSEWVRAYMFLQSERCFTFIRSCFISSYYAYQLVVDAASRKKAIDDAAAASLRDAHDATVKVIKCIVHLLSHFSVSPSPTMYKSNISSSCANKLLPFISVRLMLLPAR